MQVQGRFVDVWKCLVRCKLQLMAPLSSPVKYIYYHEGWEWLSDNGIVDLARNIYEQTLLSYEDYR